MKRLKYLFIFVLSVLLFKTTDVKAFGLSASATTVYTGSPNVTVYVDMTGLTGRCKVTSSNQNVLAGGSDEWYDNQNGSTGFTVLNPGQSVITLYCFNPSDQNGDDQGDLSRTVAINVIERPQYTEPIEVNRTYSDNNYLSSLGVEGYSIIPEFDKEIEEYSLEVDYNITKVNIQASSEDDTASINGIGEVELEEGKNTFNIIVIAENGNEREYVLNIIVKELNPTKVKVNKKNYSLVKKDSSLPELENYVQTIIKIDGVDIPALKGKVTKYTIVGLKDEKGDINLFIYDEKDKSYKPYNEIKFNNLSLYYMENDKNNYKKTTIKIKGQEVVAYKKSGLDYYLIYGMNLNNGKVNWYTYDKEEGTIQKYIGSNKGNLMDNSYLYLIYSLTAISIILVLFSLILAIKNKKKNELV